jgi:hypothetical protein
MQTQKETVNILACSECQAIFAYKGIPKTTCHHCHDMKRKANKEAQTQ